MSIEVYQNILNITIIPVDLFHKGRLPVLPDYVPVGTWLPAEYHILPENANLTPTTLLKVCIKLQFDRYL